MSFDYPEAGASVPASGPAKEEPMALKPYKVKVNGHETTLLLSDEDAKKQGLLDPETKKAPAPANKARRAPNKAK